MPRHRVQAEPRSHWVLLTLLLATVFVLLVIAGVAGGQLGEGAHEPVAHRSTSRVPPAVLDGGPVVDPSRQDTAGLRMANGHVALTFDDGPTKWTADILDELKRRDVKATFFVIGTRVADRPDLVRRMLAEGHEIGVHTMSHINMANVPPWRLRLELDQTQLAIAAATGKTTDLLRPPFSSHTEDLHGSEWEALTRAPNYRVVFADLDTEDWRRPGVAKIVASGTPEDDKGAVIMLHDGGGDRAQTVTAVGTLITELTQRGYSFDTVTQGVGLPSPWHAASTTERAKGRVSVTVVRVSQGLVDVLRIAFLALAALAVARTLLLLLLARRHSRRPLALGEWSLPGISVVVPAYNEELGIAACVRSLVASDYPLFEIIVVDDGSSDNTSEVVRALALPGVRLIRQENGGKPAALNTGIATAQYDVLVLVDGDTVFEVDAMRELVAPLEDPAIGAVSGNAKVGNRGGLLGRWQHIEYVIGFNLDRRMFDVLECMPTVPGAIGAFRRSVLLQVGGVSDETLAEDTDLTMAICRAGWRVVYAPEARAWTEAPASLGQLWRQRYRWCYGTMQSMWKHRRSVIERGASGKLGRRGIPYLLAFQVILPLLAPVIDIAALYTVIFLATPKIVYVWLAFLALQYIGAIYAFRLDRERLGPLWSLGLQQVVYRQLMYLVVIQSMASAVYGIRLRWQQMRRTGDLESSPVGSGI